MESKEFNQFIKTKCLKWAVILIGLVIVLVYNFRHSGTLYSLSPDGTLYLSVADNFWKTGHFIQSARPYESGMIVPFGLPLILTFLRIIFRDIWGIVTVQYLIFVATGYLIGEVISSLFKENFKYWDTDNTMWGGILSTVGTFLYWFSEDIFRGAANPAYILTEVWTSFFIVLFLYSLFCYDSITARLIVSYILFVIRPVFYPFLIYTIINILFIARRLSAQNKKRILRIIAVAALLFLLNVASNYRETGKCVFLENYAGIAMYQANNPSTKTDGYHSGRATEFVSEEDTQFWDTYNDKTLTCGQKNEIYISMASAYIKIHAVDVLNNTWAKVLNLFWDRYGAYSKIALIAFIVAAFKNHRIFNVGIVFYTIAFTTGFGLNIARYSIFILPFYLIAIFWLIGILMNQLLLSIRQEGFRGKVTLE